LAKKALPFFVKLPAPFPVVFLLTRQESDFEFSKYLEFRVIKSEFLKTKALLWNL